MSATLMLVKELVARREARASVHAYEELAVRGILFREVIAGIEKAMVVEDYPDAFKGPSVLVLQKDARGQAIHVLWGVPKGHSSPAVLITAYRPDAALWSADFMNRRRQ